MRRIFMKSLIVIMILLFGINVGVLASGDTVVMAITSSWDTLNPYNITGIYGDVIFDQVYDRLIGLSQSGECTPRLAKNWSISEDHKSMTFELNENAYWHDGEEVTADDIVFTCQLVTNPEFSSNRRSYFNVLAGTDDSGAVKNPGELGVEKITKYKFNFKFKKPLDSYSFLNIFGHFFFVLPEHILGDVPIENINIHEYWQQPVGSGPFVFENQMQGNNIELSANKNYFLGIPDFETLVIKVVKQSNLTAGLINEEIDIIGGGGIGSIPLEDWSLIKEQEHLIAKSIPTFAYQYMAINTGKPYLSDPKVRRAIDLAINKEVFVEFLLKGHGLKATSPLPKHHPFFNEDLLPIEYDPAKAKEMLAEAGWDKTDELTMLVPIGNVIRERSAPLIQQDLKKIGINVRIRKLDFPTLIKRAREGDFDFTLIGGAGSPDPDDSSVLMLPDSPINFAHIDDKELATLALEGRSGKSFEERKETYNKYQKRLKELCPYVWLYHQNSLMAYNKRINNVKPEDFFQHNYATCKWEIEGK